jgi:hypothetical protein
MIVYIKEYSTRVIMRMKGVQGPSGSGGGGGGTTDHSALDNLTADDHTQYLNNTRGDVRYYTKSQVDTALGAKANSSHTHPISDVTGLQTALDNKVDKVSGKGLSTEDYTTAEKTKLSGIATGATANDTDANLKDRSNHTGTQLAATISNFASTVLVTVLTGLSLASSAVISATDTILQALGKLQAQITGMKTMNSFIRLANVTGYGSETNNKVFIYSTVEDSAGSDLVHVSSATEGSYVECMAEGLYNLNASHNASATASIIGITRNVSAANRLTGVNTLTYAQGRLTKNFAVPNRSVDMSVPKYLFVGDKIRVQSDGATLPAASDLQYLEITRIR